MASITLKGNPIQTSGELPAVGQAAPDFQVTTTELSELSLSEMRGKKLVLNIFPSIDTGICAASVRRFNEAASQRPEVTVLNISADLPFAQKRFCGAEGLEKVQNASSFRSDFGQKYGVTIQDGPMKGLLARAVLVLDEQGKVLHAQLVPEIVQEPDYDGALGVL